MHPAPETPTAIDFGRFRVLVHRRELLADNRPVELGGRAFDVLLVLIEARGAVVSKETLMQRVWPGRIVDENNLPAQITALRRAFAGDRDLIRTVPGRGYQFIGEVHTVSGSHDALPDATMAAPAAASVRSPTNLSEPVSELIGREVELGEMLGLTASHRLVTLVGAGGIGKTSLSIECGRDSAAAVCRRCVDRGTGSALRSRTRPGHGRGRARSGAGWRDAVCRTRCGALGSRQLLLILDNCEHLIEAAARMAEALLRVNPSAHLMATSREPLRTPDEQIYVVPALTVPGEGTEDREELMRSGALRLFLARAPCGGAAPAARRTRHGCRGRDQPAPGRHPPGDRAGRSARSRPRRGGAGGSARRPLQAARRGHRTALARHQTLRATLDWSYELSPRPNARCCEDWRCSRAGLGWTRPKPVASDAHMSASEVVECLANLVAKSLVSADLSRTASSYRLLETTRAYALEKLTGSGVRCRCTPPRRVLPRADRSRSSGMGLAPDGRMAGRVWRTLDNVRAALDWAFSPAAMPRSEWRSQWPVCRCGCTSP